MPQGGVFGRLAHAAGFKEVSKVAVVNALAVMPERHLPAPVDHGHARNARCAARLPIDGLEASAGPAHIARRVVAIVIYPVRAVVGAWALSDIIKKGLVRVAPLITDGDTSPAIAGIAGITRVVAAINHALPTFVGGCRRAAMVGLSVLRLSLSTPATNCSSAPDVGGIQHLLRTTLALVKPSRLVVFLFSRGNGCEPAVLFTHFKRLSHHNIHCCLNGHYASVGG